MVVVGCQGGGRGSSGGGAGPAGVLRRRAGRARRGQRREGATLDREPEARGGQAPSAW
jgi:hypothetical protein